jgi:hypothetical protein
MSEKTIEVLIRNLDDADPHIRMTAAFDLMRAAWIGKDISAALPALINAVYECHKDGRESAASALELAEPRGYTDLEMLENAARAANREGKPMQGFVKVYSVWSKKLNERAGALVSDKRFHVPKMRKPDKTERIMRVRRLA